MIRRVLANKSLYGCVDTASTLASKTPLAVTALRGQSRIDGLSVIVVGAGMSGLAAAFELQNLGAQVTVLEADPRHIGGRCRTLRQGDLFGELGAMRIPRNHDLTQFYVREMGLVLRQFVQTNANGFLRVRGHRMRMKDGLSAQSLFDITPEESKLGDGGLWESTITRIASTLSSDELADLYSPELRTEVVKNIDRQSLYHFWSKSQLSDEAIQLLATTWSLESSLHVSLLEHVREEHEGTWVNGMDEIVGGIDTLPAAIASRLTLPVRSGFIVNSIVQSDNKVRATGTNASGIVTLEADWLICTVPLGVIARIQFDPPLSAKKRDAARRVSYDSATKVLGVARRRFWETEDDIYGGGSISDGVLSSTWYPSDNAELRDQSISSSPAMFLASYTWGQQARRMSKDISKTLVPRELALMHDSLASDPSLVKLIARWSWDEYPWTNGAYAFFQPGEHADRYSDIIAPEGRVLLAGEHASTTHSWIQGAIQSGLRVASEIATRA